MKQFKFMLVVLSGILQVMPYILATFYLMEKGGKLWMLYAISGVGLLTLIYFGIDGIENRKKG